MLRQFAALFVALCLGFAPHPALAVLKGSGSPTAGQIAASQSGEDSLTAFAGGGQTNATALSATVTNHRVTTVATAADSVKLPAATVGQAHYVRNDGAASMQVFGQATETIDGVASATGVAQAAGTGVWYISTTAAKWTRSAVYNPANVAITGGTIGGTTAIDGSSLASGSGIPVIAFKTGLPFIALSSGSVAANGAISAITALPFAYPKAFCYFPANALATSIAAGWYYCTFSTTTAGTAFLDTYTSGVPAIPASPAAVTDGKGAFVGVTGAITALTYNLPAGAMGLNGQMQLRNKWMATNNANAKTILTTFGGTGMTSTVITSLVNFLELVFIENRGTTGIQLGNIAATNSGGTGGSASGFSTASIDTTAQVAVARTINRATATDNVILESVLDLLYSDGA